MSSSSSGPATSPTIKSKSADKGSFDRSCDCPKGGGQAKAKAPKQCSSSPVYYYNGEVSLQDSDLPGPVAGFGHTRSYSNRLAPAPGTSAGLFEGPNGNNILNPSLPFIVKDGGDFILMMGQERIWFNSSMVAQYGAGDTYTMSHDTTNDLWVVEVHTGRGVMTYEFQDDSGGNSNPEGLLYRGVDSYGNETKVETYSNDQVEEVRYKSASGGDAAYSILYAFYGSGAHTERIETATLRYTADDTAGTITWEDIRRASYTYYGGSESHGSRNDLKLVTQQAPASGGGWDDAAKSYYRWYKDGDDDGFEGGLKYAVGPQAYAEMVLDGKTPETASDGDVADYAEHYFEYDDTTQEVTKEVARDCAGCGGGGTGDSGETFTRTASAHADGYNNWKTKTVLTKANGNVVTVYTNYLGQVMLRELKETSSSSRKWISYTKYGATGAESGKVIESATPAAVSTYNDTNADLGVTLHSGAGLITVYAYGSSTTASGNTLGDVAGYLKTTSIKEGSSGTAVKQREVQYKSSTNTSGEKAYVVGKETRYQDEASGGSDPVATEYTYTWHSSPHETAIETVETKLPVVATGQNGDGTQYYTRRKLDTSGRVVMSLDERDILTTMAYNHTTGRITERVLDAAKPGKGYPLGWPDPVTPNEEVKTTYGYDTLGRQTEMLGEAHDADLGGASAEEVQHATWTVYTEAVTGDQVWTGRGYHKTAGAGTDVLVDPVSIAINDKRGRTTDAIQSRRSTGSGKLSASDTFLRADWSRWTVSLYTTKGQLQYQRVYHTIPPQTPTDEGLDGVTQDPGVQGTNYEETHHLYEDDTNLRIKTISPDETITRTVYDPINRVESQWIGTDDTGATAADPTGGGASKLNNMVKVSENTYDAGAAGGNSYLTKVEQFVDGSDTRETSYTYDFRGRRTATDGEETLYSTSTYDNLNRVTKVEQKDTTSGGNLIDKQETFYDDRGRVYRTKVYGVDPSTGTVGEDLTGNNTYDASGNLIKSIAPGGGLSWSRTEYDHLGRASRRYTGYDDDAAPDDEVVVEESVPTYNKVGQVLETHRKQRDTGSSIASPTFRSLYTAGWYDGVGRSIGNANYGTNGGSAPTRPGTVPASSSTVLVGTTAYNDAGEAYSVTDPEGIETRREFDQMGRVTKQIDNYQPPGSSGGSSGPDVNRTTEFTYTADSQQETVTAKMTNAADDEVTTYVYGVDTDGGSDLAANNLLFAIQYPTDTTSSRIELKYNRLGQVTERKDQNGTIHQYIYDGLGRPTADTASTIPAGVDDAVKRLTTVYNTRGQAQTLTSHSTTSGTGNEVNQVEFEYNDFGQLTSDWQEHDGTVVTSGSPSLRMQYAYTPGSGSAGSAADNRIRLDTYTYPDGKILKRGYGGENGVDGAINRSTNIREEASGGGFQTVANYRYLGAGRFVVVNDVEAGLKLDQWGNTAGSYDGLDNFNRSIGFLWEDTAPSPDVAVADLAYGYDQDSLPTYREDLQAQANSQDYDELYVRDGLNRLDDYQRGELNAGHTAMTTTTFRQTWSLDQVANWTEFKQDDGDGSGGWDLDQDRTHNKVNEITAITGGGWNAPSYNDVGNTTQAPSPGDPGTSASDLKCTYDAWNRLVKVTDNAGTPATLAEYGYDARSFRIQKKEYSAGSHDSTRDYYYSSQWQCVEERVTDESTSTTTLDRQYIWGLRYVDDLVRRDRDTTGNGTLDETLYALTDRQFNVIGLWDPNASGGAAIVERMAYDPYGLVQFLNENFSTKSSSGYDWNTLFQGLHRDDDTGMYYNRNRELHPLLGRFMQRDPLGYPDGLNAYAAYHVMWSGNDPRGLTSSICKQAEECTCKSITTGFSSEANGESRFTEEIDGWHLGYSYDGGLRIGTVARTVFRIEGDVHKCQYHQNEEGFLRVIDNQNPPDEQPDGTRPTPEFPDEGSDLWDPENDDTTEIIGRDNQIRRNNSLAIFDQENQKVTYNDPIGFSIRNGRLAHIWIELSATAKCVSSSGEEMEESFSFHGKISVYRRGGRPENWIVWNEELTTTNDTIEED